jgi:hypothetical protein
MNRYRSRLAARAPLGVALLLAAACGGAVTGPPGSAGVARLVVSADVAATSIELLVVEVTAADIATPLVFNIPVAGGAAVGTLVLPAGADRVLTGRAFDGSGLETHRGTRVVAVGPGPNPGVALTLAPLHGEQPVEVTIGSYAVTVTPSQAAVVVGGAVQLAAAIEGPDQEVVAGPAGWASLAPAIATVSAAGLVTGHAAGEVVIVATYGGSGGTALVAVTAP